MFSVFFFIVIIRPEWVFLNILLLVLSTAHGVNIKHLQLPNRNFVILSCEWSLRYCKNRQQNSLINDDIDDFNSSREKVQKSISTITVELN